MNATNKEAPSPLHAGITLYGETFQSRLLLGTSRYPSPEILAKAVEVSKPGMLTASLRRQSSDKESSKSFWNLLQKLNVPILPNTAGCHSKDEVIATAQMAREIFETDWIKLELIGDDYTLQPDTVNLVGAAQSLMPLDLKCFPTQQMIWSYAKSLLTLDAKPLCPGQRQLELGKAQSTLMRCKH